MNWQSYIHEVETSLSGFPKRTSAQNPEAYIGGGQSNLRFIGLRVPHLQQAMKKGFSFFTQSDLEIAQIWDHVWQNSDCYEVMSLALSWFYDSKQRSSLKTHWPKLKTWSARIDNWAHADTLSGIYARILEDFPQTIYPTLLAWNKSKNPWLRRLSMVSLLYYSSQRNKVLPVKKILSLVETQLEFDHYYVQKGVGWTLRESHNVYPKPTFIFIEKNILRLSAQAFSAATEKMSPAQKIRLKKLRQGNKKTRHVKR